MGTRESGANGTKTPVWIDAGAGGIAGTAWLGELGSRAYGGYLGMELGYGGPSIRAAGVRILENDGFDEGNVALDLWAAWFGPCWRFGDPTRWAIRPCAAFGIGRQQGEAEGFAENSHASSPWRVLLADVALRVPLGDPLGAMLSAGGIFRLHEQRYLVDDRVAVDQDPVGLFVALGVSSTWSLGGQP